MTQKEKKQLEEIKNKLENIYKWDNKNLLLRQYYKIDDCIEILKNLLKD